MSEEQHFICNLTDLKDWRIGMGSIGHGANQGITGQSHCEPDFNII